MVRHLLPRHGLTEGGNGPFPLAGKVGMGEEVRKGVLHRLVPILAPMPMKGAGKRWRPAMGEEAGEWVYIPRQNRC